MTRLRVVVQAHIRLLCLALIWALYTGGIWFNFVHTGPKYFQTGKCVDPEQHYYVPLHSKRMEDNLDQGKFCLLVGHRQAGKSTLALSTANARTDCLYIYLREFEVCLCLVHVEISRRSDVCTSPTIFLMTCMWEWVVSVLFGLWSNCTVVLTGQNKILSECVDSPGHKAEAVDISRNCNFLHQHFQAPGSFLRHRK